MSGWRTASQGAVQCVDPASGWQVQGVGDFDGDGKADILWRNSSTGENYIYLMNGLTIASQGSINAVGGQAWQVKGIGDFDGDGKADILWRNTSTGENYIWLMNGLSTASQGSVNFVDPASGWQVQRYAVRASYKTPGGRQYNNCTTENNTHPPYRPTSTSRRRCYASSQDPTNVMQLRDSDGD